MRMNRHFDSIFAFMFVGMGVIMWLVVISAFFNWPFNMSCVNAAPICDQNLKGAESFEDRQMCNEWTATFERKQERSEETIPYTDQSLRTIFPKNFSDPWKGTWDERKEVD